MPISNTFLSKLILCSMIKNVKSISGVNYIDSLHMKWCTLKNMGYWPFSPGHARSHKTNNILRTAADMTKIKTNICRKHIELSMISNVLVEKGHLCNNFPNHLPPNFIIFHSMWFMILLMILQKIWDIPVIFVPCRVFGVFNNMQTSFYGNTVLSYLPMDQPLQICVKHFWQKMCQSCFYW